MAEPGLYYLRARYYDPEIGRFLSQDPLPAGNLYAYVGNNPTNFIDPRGLIGHPDLTPDFADNAIECVDNALDCISVEDVSTAVQLADLAPLGAIPFANLFFTVVSVPLDFGAFGFAQYEALTSGCSFSQTIHLTVNNVANLGAGIGGQVVAVIASSTIVGSAIISFTVSAFEATLYVDSLQTLKNAAAKNR